VEEEEEVEESSAVDVEENKGGEDSENGWTCLDASRARMPFSTACEKREKNVRVHMYALSLKISV